MRRASLAQPSCTSGILNSARAIGMTLCMFSFALTTGCAGQLKGVMVEHAKSTRSVADTIKKALESVKCDSTAAACPTAVSVIEDQIKALQDGANKLENGSR